MKNIEKLKKEHHLLAKAIKFLVDKVLNANGEQKEEVRTEKPLVIHSLETAFYLKYLGYNINIIISGLLHDLLEDTNTTKKEIEDEFGPKIADIVEILSFDLGVNKGTYYKNSFDKMADFKDALIVRAADIIVNSKYFQFASPKEKLKVLQKWTYFLKIAQKISNEPIYKKLKREIDKIHPSK